MDSVARKQRGIRLTVTVLVSVIALIVLLFIGEQWLASGTGNPKAPDLSAVHAVVFPLRQQISSFSLRADNGARYSEKALSGHWTLAFLAGTRCVGDCAATLQTLRALRATLEPSQPKPRFLMVATDPTLDTPQALHAYLQPYGDGFRAVTGAHDSLAAFARDLKSAYDLPAGTVARSRIARLALIDPEGKLVALLQPPFAVETLRSAYLRTVSWEKSMSRLRPGP